MMKPSVAIVSSDANPFYFDFWPVVARQWNTRLGITPVLCYVADDSAPDPSCPYGTVIRLKPVAGIPLPFQAQWARFFQAQRCREETAIISDIDMLPLSKFYFIDQLASLDENRYYHLNPCTDTYGHLPACYHVAKGRVFKEVIDTPESWEESCRFVHDLRLGPEIRLPHLGDAGHWFLDELFTTGRIRDYPDQGLFTFLPRSRGPVDRRIDRSKWSYRVDLLRQEYYFDAHCPRPYRSCRHLIEPVLRGEGLPWRFRAVNTLKRCYRGIQMLAKKTFSKFRRKVVI